MSSMRVNSSIEKMRPSVAREFKAKAKKIDDSSLRLIDLTSGDPNFETPEPIRMAAIREIANGNTHYRNGKGIKKLRDRICEKLHDENGIEANPDQVFVTPGAKMAVYYAVRTCIEPGDEVIIPYPSWVSYREIVCSAGGVAVPLLLSDGEGYRISYEALSSCSSDKTRMLIVCTPNNPTGHIMDSGEIEDVARFACERDVVVLSDEIYERLTYGGLRTKSLASFERLRDRTVTVNGFSKAFAMTGWRLGYLVAPMAIAEQLYKLHTHTISGVSPFLQEACYVAFECGDATEAMRREYESRANDFCGVLANCEGVFVNPPDGGFYAWVKFDVGIEDSMRLAEDILEKTHVVGMPGVAYGGECGPYVRFSLANPHGDIIEAARRIRLYAGRLLSPEECE